MATDSGPDERDGDANLAAAVHRVLALLTDLRSEAHTPELKDRIRFVQWLRRELSDVEALLVRADAVRDSATTRALASAPAGR